jgi:hypothetical protein
LITSFDSCTLAGIDGKLSEEEKHNQFIQGHIDIAAQSLLSKLNTEISVAIGLSIGGTILWRAVQNGLKVGTLICLSSTRLRFEEESLNIPCQLFFGSEDSNRPCDAWFKKIDVEENLIAAQGHEFYQEEIVFEILKTAIQKFRVG